MAQVWSDAHTRHRGVAAEAGDYRGWGHGANGRELLAEFDRLAAAGVLVE